MTVGKMRHRWVWVMFMTSYICGVKCFLVTPAAFTALTAPSARSSQVQLPLRQRRAARLILMADLSVVVKSVTASPMSNGCLEQLCSQALGFVTCDVSGGPKQSQSDAVASLQNQPLAMSYYAVGSSVADGATLIVPCGSGVKQGQTVSVQPSLAAPVPTDWNKEQAGLFPALCIIFLQNLQLAGISDLSVFKGKTVVVTGGLGPAASLALQLVVAAGGKVVATGAAGDAGKLKSLGAHRVIDYKKNSFFDDVADIFMIIDGLGADFGNEKTGLTRNKVSYVSVMHPAVALVVREGLWNGGRALQRHLSGQDKSCEFQASEEAMQVCDVVYIYTHTCKYTYMHIFTYIHTYVHIYI